MKYKFLILLLLFAVASSTFAQKVPRFKKITIMNSGCSAYFPEEPKNFEVSFSEDSSLVYTASTEFDGFVFGIIAVKFKEQFTASKTEHEDMAVSYMDFIKTLFNIQASTGYGKGHTHRLNENAIGVIDYWEDSQGQQYKVKCWIDENYICFMYIHGAAEYPYFEAAEMFLNGFIFGK